MIPQEKWVKINLLFHLEEKEEGEYKEEN